MDVDEKEKLFKFWLSQGYKFRKPHSTEMQADPQVYKDRMIMEYNVIRSIPGYIDYFLIVSDLVRWAKDRGILVGPGRGSAAGSLCCWFLRITEIDPLLYPMLFERFISRDRTDLPDIDIDFEDERRWEVIEYAQLKYGYDRVANIQTFVKYKGANSLNDIGTVYRIDQWAVDTIKDKLVERADGHPRYSLTIRDTIDSYDDVAAVVRTHPELELATQLEGNQRHSSIHPAGIVIAGVNLDYVSATYEKQSGKDRGSAIAYDKKDAEYLNLLKVDFLSLTTLTGVRATLDSLGMSIQDFYRIPLDDPKVYQAFRDTDVLGIFQFEGHTTKRVLKAVQPTTFMDLVDVNALSRPGGDDAAYVKAKNAGKVPDVNPVALQHLMLTHGTIVYQEQIMLILRDYGNFEPTEVNRVRKIISAKEDQSVLNEYFGQFAKGAATHGDSEGQASGIWRQILAATGYAFNISHAACYTDTAYRQMWLKVHHSEFYLGQLAKCPDDKEGLDRRRKLIVEANGRGIAVLPPNLVHSQQNWVLEGANLYAGFASIKGIGPKIADNIVAWRDQQPIIKGWDDLLAVHGVGQGRVDKIRDFAEAEDPFDLGAVGRVLDSIRRDFDNNEFPGVATPTHRAQDIHTNDDYVVFVGVLKKKHYKDAVSQKLKYGGEGLTRESILESLDSPHLLKYATLDAVDEYDEPVRIRVGRKKFPQFRAIIAAAVVDETVVHVKGYVSTFGGVGIQVQDLVMIDPE